MRRKDKIHIGFDVPLELHERIVKHQSMKEDELMRKVTLNSICIDAIRDFLDSQEYEKE